MFYVYMVDGKGVALKGKPWKSQDYLKEDCTMSRAVTTGLRTRDIRHRVHNRKLGL